MFGQVPTGDRQDRLSRLAVGAVVVGVLAMSVAVVGSIARGGGSGSAAVVSAVQPHPAGSTGPAAGAVGATRSTPARAPSVRPGSIPPVQRPDPAQIGLLHVRPRSVSIPSIKVNSSLVDLGLNTDGSLEVPSDFAKAGWYTGGQYPGDANGPPALIAGHIDNLTGPAVFYRLAQLHVGAQVLVRRIDGSVAPFQVYRIGTFLKSQFPAASIYAPVARPELRLITCTGEFDRHTGSYLSDFVVFARLSLPKTKS